MVTLRGQDPPLRSDLSLLETLSKISVWQRALQLCSGLISVSSALLGFSFTGHTKFIFGPSET